MPLDFANHSDGFTLVCSGGDSVLTGAVKDANGMWRKTFRKALVKTGDWQMSNGQRFTITGADLDNYATQFTRMQAAGVAVPLPMGHTNDPAATRGYLVGAYVDGDTLWGSTEFIGEDAIKQASVQDVSIYVPPQVTDGKGVVYPRAIEHVALTSTPVVTGLGEFVPIAASRGVFNVPVLRLALTPHGVSQMDYKKLAALLGIDAGSMDEAALAAACEAKIKSLVGGADKPHADTAALSLARTELATVKAELAAAKAPAAKPDPIIVKLSRENREMKLDALVVAGKITPNVRAKMGVMYTAGDALTLSLDAVNDARFDSLVAALSENNPIELGEKARVIEASRTTPGGNGEMTRERADELSNELAGVSKK